MENNYADKMWVIWKQVMQQAQYATVAKNYNESVNELQALEPSFTREHWMAVERYRDAFMDLHQAMMRIALEKSK